jgi:hypothetical protein
MDITTITFQPILVSHPPNHVVIQFSITSTSTVILTRRLAHRDRTSSQQPTGPGVGQGTGESHRESTSRYYRDLYVLR